MIEMNDSWWSQGDLFQVSSGESEGAFLKKPRISVHVNNHYWLPLISSTCSNHLDEQASPLPRDCMGLQPGFEEQDSRILYLHLPPIHSAPGPCQSSHLFELIWAQLLLPTCNSSPVSRSQYEFGTLRLSFHCVTTVAPNMVPTTQLWPTNTWQWWI